MKTLILPLLLSLAAPAAAAQPARRQQPQQVRLPNQRQRVVVLPVRRPQHLRVQSCGIGRWVDGVFTCQAGPVERALDRLNDTIEGDRAAIQMQQWAIQSAAEASAQAMIEANKRAADEAAYIRAITVIPPPPAGLGPIPDEKIYKRLAPNGIVIYSNVQ